MSDQITFKAALTDAEVERLATSIAVSQREEMPTIRGALILLARASDQVDLKEPADAEAFVELLECVNETIDRKKELVGMLEAAQARLLILLQRWAEEEGEE